MAASVAGLVASTAAFGTLLLAPDAVEHHVRTAVIGLLKQELSQRFGVEIREYEVVGRVQQDWSERIASLERDLNSPSTLGAAFMFSQLCHYSCGSPLEVSASMRDSIRRRIDRFEDAAQRIRGWATSRYSTLVTAFVHEMRIFTASNAILFLLALLGLSISPTNRVVQTVSLLIVATAVTAATFYMRNQDWLLTFVLSDYVGWGYLVWAGVLFAFLVDMVFLRGHITHAVLNVLSAPFSGGG